MWYILGILVVTLGFSLGRAAMLVRATPDYWEDNRSFLDETPEAELGEIAQAVESRLPTEWTRPIGQGDGLRTIRVHYDEVNAWLAVRMPEYLNNQKIELPREIGQFMVTQRDGDLVVAFDYESKRFGPRIASVFFQFQSQSAEQDLSRASVPLQGRIRRVRAGEQNLPVTYLTRLMAENYRPDDEVVQKAIAALGRYQFVDLPSLPVDEHRQAQIMGIEVLPQAVDVIVQVRYNRDIEAQVESSGPKLP